MVCPIAAFAGSSGLFTLTVHKPEAGREDAPLGALGADPRHGLGHCFHVIMSLVSHPLVVLVDNMPRHQGYGFKFTARKEQAVQEVFGHVKRLASRCDPLRSGDCSSE